MYVGAITADEAIFAGGKYKSDNNNYYLTDSLNYIFLTITPNFSTVGHDAVFAITNIGGINNFNVDSVHNSFRPLIQLKPGIGISKGDGTKDNAYMIS